MSTVACVNNIFNQLEITSNARQNLRQRYSIYAIVEHALKDINNAIKVKNDQPIQLREADIEILQRINGDVEKELITDIINIFSVCLEDNPKHPENTELLKLLKVETLSYESKKFQIIDALAPE